MEQVPADCASRGIVSASFMVDCPEAATVIGLNLLI